MSHSSLTRLMTEDVAMNKKLPIEDHFHKENGDMQAAGLAALDLTMVFGGDRKIIHPALIWDEQDVILVDTGTPGQLEVIRNEMEKLGVPFRKLTKIIVTHQDLDHIGSLPELLGAADHKIEVLAHEMTKPYLEGDKRLIRLPAAAPAPAAKVDTVLKDGEVLPYCGGITVISTPGHTPDHTSFYVHAYRTLLAGDAAIAVQGRLLGPAQQHTLDMDEAIRSLSKLLSYDIETVVCYHGGICQHEVKQRLAMLANT